MGSASPRLSTPRWPNSAIARPTPIQAQAIPALMKGRDLVGIAQTGTGKTAAFALPILHRLADRPAPGAEGRRARAGAVARRANSPARSRRASATYPASSRSRSPSSSAACRMARRSARWPHGLDVLVATPGRLLDHLDARVANLGAVEFLVLDEVDQMLDLGFIKPIRRIVRELPKKRQNLFFSATMPTDIRALAGELLQRSGRGRGDAGRQDRRARRAAASLFVDAAKKRDLLVELFDDPDDVARARLHPHQARRRPRRQGLDEAGVDAAAIHGNKSQGQRERALGRLPRRQDARAGRHRHRRARHRHRRRHPCRQFRAARRRRSLCPPHRPHRARRRRRAGRSRSATTRSATCCAPSSA